MLKGLILYGFIRLIQAITALNILERILFDLKRITLQIERITFHLQRILLQIERIKYRGCFNEDITAIKT